MPARTLVAGIGNVFFGDDGFGVEVAQRLARQPLPEGVRVLDTGIRARHLAYELLDGGYETAILVDAVSRGGPPGTLYVIDPGPGDSPPPDGAAELDGHGLTPDTVLAFVRNLGGSCTRIRILGCEPGSVDEGIGLTPDVDAAVPEALAVLRDLLTG
jgi:hydrogenase maturation protease